MTQPAPLELDVRPIIRDGEDPFGAIMAAVDVLSPGQALHLLAPFRPAPLFTVMASRGFGSQDRHRNDGTWEVLFTPAPSCGPDADMTPGSADDAGLWPDAVHELDLTGLTPPEPMVRILEAVTGLAPGEVLFALLDREPMFLFPELAQRGHEWAGNFARSGQAYRLLVRAGARDD